jgi:hypothetical protein
MKPARYDITLPQRATFRQRFKIPLDFTDREVVAQVWSVQGRTRGVKLLDFTVEWIDRAAVEIEDGEEVTKGVFDLVGTHLQTAAVTLPAQWDLLVVDGVTLHDGERNYWLHGVVNLDPGLSEPEE